MPVHPTVEAADCPAAEQLLLTIGRAGVLSCRAIAAGELDTLLRLLGPPSERQRSGLKRATDVVLVEDGAVIYWPRTGEQFADAAYAMTRVQATLGMSTAALKRELALLRSSLAALTPSQSATLDDPVAWAERIAGLTLDPSQRDVLLSAITAAAAQRHATERQEHSGRAQGCLDGFGRRPCGGGLAVAAAVGLPVP